MILENLEYSEFASGISASDIELYSIIQNLQKVMTMLIFDYPEWIQPTVAQVLIPKAAYQLTPEFEQIDKMLQDEFLEEPIVERFNT